jgi:hypothetical protein
VIRFIGSWLFALAVVVFYVSYCAAIGHLKAKPLMDMASDEDVGTDFVSVVKDSSQIGIALFINEFGASNNTIITDPQGEYDDWIEIYNAGDGSIDIGGMYLTDNLGTPTKWRIPDNVPVLTTISPKGFILIWADNDTDQSGLHASFELNSDGEEVALFDTDGTTLIDSVEFDDQKQDISYARFPDGTDNWGYMTSPTPGSTNTDSLVNFVADTKFSHNRGFYDSPFEVAITSETPGATIYYTLDGSEPYENGGRSPTSRLYSGPILINTTTCLRAVAVKQGWVSSNVDTHTYIFVDDVIRQSQSAVLTMDYPSTWSQSYQADYEMDPEVVDDPRYKGLIKEALLSLPSISIVTDKNNLFSHENDPQKGGIYIYTGAPGIGGDGWERPVSAEFFSQRDTKEFQINCGLRIQGGHSRYPYKCPKHSLSLRFRATYGPTNLDFELFDDWPVDSFNMLHLRGVFNNAWTHWAAEQRRRAQYIRDQWMRDCLTEMGQRDACQGFFVHLYLNGIYWGVYNLQERPDASHYAVYNGGDEENIDAINGDPTYVISDPLNSGKVTDGTIDAWLELKDIVTSRDWEKICQFIDVDSFIDWTLLNYFAGITDIKFGTNWRAAGGGQNRRAWRFYSWDAEHVLEDLDQRGIGTVQDPTGLFGYLRDIDGFRVRFGDRVHKHLFNGGALTADRNIQRWIQRANEINLAVIAESARWGDYRRDVHSWSSGPYELYTKDEFWIPEQSRLLNDYFPNRTNIALEQFRNMSLYPNVDAPVFHVNGSYQHGGHISSNDSFSITSSSGTVWYTLDTNDPRLPGTTPEEGPSYTLVAEDDPKLILVPTGPIDDGWKSDWNFNISQWTIGTGGVGYERGSGYEGLIDTDVGDMMYGLALGCYVRVPFTVDTDISSFNSLTLKMQYDDGFVAYLNGTEISRAMVSGTPEWNSMADGNHEAQGFESFNVSEHMDSLKQGQNILAIHGLNVSYTSSDFIISCELVASESSPTTGGGVSPTAIRYTGPISLNQSTHVKARTLSGSTWSALNEATFAVGPVKENLRITEIMYNPQDTGSPDDPNTEFIELTNIGNQTINLNLVRFTNGVDFTFPGIELTPGQYVLVVKDISAFEAKYGGNYNIAGQYTGSLNNAGERIELQDAAGQVIHNFRYGDGWYDITDGLGFSLTVKDPVNTDPNSLSDKGSWRPSATVGGSPGEDDTSGLPELGSVVINELLAHSHIDTPDWIELHNTTSRRINIGGWFLSDDDSDFRKYEIAQGTSIGPHGYIVFYEDEHFGNMNDPGCNTSFALSENGETLYLHSGFAGELTGYSEQERFGASETAIAFGRYQKSTGTYNFVAMSENTPGGANSYPKVGPIVINEIMYHPPAERDAEYVELLNISDYPVELYDSVDNEPWRFTDDPDDPGIEFLFPSASVVTMEPGEYLLLVKDLDIFSSMYSVPGDVQVFSWGAGRLANGSEKIQLSKPGDVDGEGVRQWIRVDRVVYSDGSHDDEFSSGVDPWPVEADGGGSSLSRLEPSEYGNDVANWQAAEPSPGSATQ